MATKVEEAQRSLRRSEADVSTLEQRQRELANEKAQIEDERQGLSEERDALGSVAVAMIQCKNGLFSIVRYLAEDDYSSASYYWDSVSYDCGLAEDAVDDYLSVYGG